MLGQSLPNQSFALLVVPTYIYTYVHMYTLLTALFPWMNNISGYSLVIWSIVSSSCISQDPPLSSNLSSVLHWPVHQWSLESSHLIVMCNVYISIAGKHIYVCYWKLMNDCMYLCMYAHGCAKCYINQIHTKIKHKTAKLTYVIQYIR